MKFILGLVAIAAAQTTGIDNSCTKDTDCEDTADGDKQRCATMTMEGFSVDQCVAEILCGETMELEGVEMNYNCFDGGATKMMASMIALIAVVCAM